MAELLYKIGGASARHAVTVIVAWAAVLALAAVGYLTGHGALSNNFDIPGTASSQVTDRLADELPEFQGASGLVVIHTADGSAFTDAQRADVGELVAQASQELTSVTGVIDPFATEQERATAASQIEEGRAQLAAAEQQLETGRVQLADGFAALDAAQTQLDALRTQAEAAGSDPAALAAIDEQQTQLDGQRELLETQQAEADAAGLELAEQSANVEAGAELLSLASGITLVSDDGSVAVINVSFSQSRLELADESREEVIAFFTDHPVDGVLVDFSTDIAQGVPEIMGVGEIAGLLVAAIVLLVMLGSALAAALPLCTAIVGVGVGVMVALAFSGAIQMAAITPILGVMLGLAVGIDYSLFIVNRHRRQRAQGTPLIESIALANGTAGNAVLFAGSTVVIALLALNITGVGFLGLMGTVGAVCIAVAVIVAITLTPALLALLGDRVLPRRVRERLTASLEAGVSQRPMATKRAVITIVGAVVALGVIATPVADLRLGLPDGSSEPADSTTYRAYQLTSEAFGAGTNATLLVTAELPEGLDEQAVAAQQLVVARAVATLGDVVAVAPVGVSDDNRLAAFQVIPGEGPNSESTESLVHQLRALTPDGVTAPLGVAGAAAMNIDISQKLSDVLPLYLAVVIGLSLVIMVGVFRSILVPLVATGGFVLSLLATYGAIVAVFQWGWLGSLLGINEPGPILSFLPVILVGILFGLAMDYQLFLASGMREAYVHGASAKVAVAQGFGAGRSVVIAAALIMISVFGGFVFSDSTMIRSVGFGLAFGVLVDAFVVRLLLMPALMHVLGSAAWWLPRWLDRIVPNLDVEGAALERRHHLV